MFACIPFHQSLSLLVDDGWLLCRSGKCVWPTPFWAVCSACFGFASLSSAVGLFSSRRLALAFHIPRSHVSEDLQFGFTNDPMV